MPVKYTKELLDSSIGEPPLGCRYCDRGAKMVLYITGICKQECFYCPLSEEKKDKDVIFANERKVEGDDWIEQVVDEARRMRALGTGITGGDPMVVPDRTESIIRRLKEEFGKKHHIHLYTTGPFELEILVRMKEAGLDEIRFHPPIGTWNEFHNDTKSGSSAPYDGLIKGSRRIGLVTGLEVPAVVDGPDCGSTFSDGLRQLARYGIKNGLDFINLNELEASHTNMDDFRQRGYQLVGDSMAVEGSRELALAVIDEMNGSNPGTGTVLHLCTSVYKDSIQLRNRLLRMARNLHRPFDIVTQDGTLIRGVIETGSPEEVRDELIFEFDVPEELMEVSGGRLLIAPWILEELGPISAGASYISEVYPTWDGLEVERIPIENRS